MKSIIPAFLLLIITPQAEAQYQFDEWTTKDGLPQNTINDILQTRDGYLWLATNGGLVRFDGVHFTVFNRSFDGIETERVRTLYEDRKGTLWIGSEDGKLIRYQAGKFKTINAGPDLYNAQASKIEEDDQGVLWITWHGTITAVTRFDGHHLTTFRPDNFPHNLKYQPIKIRYPWWSQDSAGLHFLQKGRVRTYSLPGGLSKFRVIQFQADQYENHWIYLQGAGVVKASDGKFRHYTTLDGLPDNNLEGFFLEDRAGRIWYTNIYSRIVKTYLIKEGKNQIISPPLNGRFYEDREGSIWIYTLKGLFRIRKVSISMLTKDDGLNSNWVYTILQDRSGSTWIGNGGINRFKNGEIAHYENLDGFPSRNITCIYEDRSGRLWVCVPSGLMFYDNGRFVRYQDSNGLLNNIPVAILQDRTGTMWIATEKGLVKSDDSRTIRYTVKDGLSNDKVTSLYEDRHGTLWIGTYQGLTRLRGDKFSTYTERDGFIGNQVRSIYQDGEGVLWIGTIDAGLYRLKDERLTRYTTKDGMYNNGVFVILEDDDENLWMSCNRGIYRVSRRDLNDFAEGRISSISSFPLGMDDGMAGLECNGGYQPSGMKTPDGRLWFPTTDGIAIVDPKLLWTNRAAPPVVIEDVQIDRRSTDFSGGVEVPYSSVGFEIIYTAPSFIKSERVKFRYRLEGLDDDWVEAGHERIARYDRVPHGTYRFTVIAANADNVWNETGQSFEITVIPPPWRRWWFIALALLGSASILFWLYWRHVSRLREKHAIQQAFSQQLIESQEAERKRVASELHDSIGQYLLLIRNKAQFGLKYVDGDSKVKPHLDDVSTLSLQALDETRNMAKNLRPSHLDELGLKIALEAMIESAANSSDIRFSTDIDEVKSIFSKEAELNIFRIAQECVSNILRHSRATEAAVTLKIEGNTASLAVKDNGRGLISDAAGSKPQSFGLTGISERARMLGSRATIHSTPGRGTEITITLPLQDHRRE